jgi:hypothetical protein
MNKSRYIKLLISSTLALSLSGFEKASFHEISGYVGQIHIARYRKWSLQTNESLQKKQTLNHEATRI